MVGNRLEHVLIRSRERAGFLVQQLQYSDCFTGFISDRQAKQRSSAISQAQIYLGLETRIGVRIRQIHHFAVLRYPAGNSLGDRQPDFMLLETETDQRPYFLLVTVHQKNGSALRSRVAGGQSQNNVEKFGEVERRIQPLCRFDDRGKLDNRATALTALERDFRVA